MSQGFAKAEFADPGWQDYTITWTGFTLGDGTIRTSRYMQIGTTVHVRVSVVLGSSSTMDSGDLVGTLPVPASSNYAGLDDPLGVAQFQDLVAFRHLGFVTIDSGGTDFILRCMPGQM